MDRFLGEARIGFDMSHPRILKVNGISSPDRKPPYFVMEYLEGKTLLEMLKGEPLPIETTLTIISGVLEGLIYAHEHPKKVIHRDLKPENIMFKKKDDYSSAVITDFGVAKVHSGTRNQTITATGFKSFFGTPEYMSPEQCSCGDIDVKTDIYSTGIVLFQLLTGKVPFTSDNDSAIFECHKNEKIPSPRAKNPAIPEWLEKTLLRALEKKAAERFESARTFLEALVNREYTSGSTLGKTSRERKTIDPSKDERRGDIAAHPCVPGPWTWDDSATGRVSFTYGSGADFPVRGVLFMSSSQIRLTPTRDPGAWGSSFIIAPVYRKSDGSPTPFMSLTHVSCALDGDDLVVGFSGTCEGLTMIGTLRLFPPGEGRLEASVSLEVAGNPTMGLSDGVEGSSFEAAQIVSMHVDDSRWDCYSAIVGTEEGGREFPIANLGTWLFPPSLGLTATRFGLRGGFNSWKPNAPTCLIEFQSSLKILGYGTASGNVNDDNLGIKACSGEVMHSYSFRITSSVEEPPPQLASLSATIESGQVKLEWTAVPGATSYNVYCAKGTAIAGEIPVMTVATTMVRVKELAALRRYAFTVAAVFPNGVSAKSSPVTVRMPRRLHGICFGPFIGEEKPWEGISEANLRTRIGLIAPYFDWIRFFGCDDSLAKGVSIAKELGLKIMAGTFLNGSPGDARQIENLVSSAKAGFVDAAVAGNELLSSGNLSVEKIQEYLVSIGSRLPASIPVFVTEGIHELMNERFKGFVGSLKQIGLNVHSFLEGKSIEDGWRFLEETLAAFPPPLPGATLIVSETGWPSQGVAKGAAVPSPENTLAHLKALTAFSEERARRGCAVSIFWFAAFDERWKMQDGAGINQPGVSYEGFWGLWNENLKFKTPEIEDFFRGNEK
ncbi:MAG: protein kinase [Candidatus Ozemobacteraceae bacterium]